MPACVYSACICCSTACDLDNILILCKGGGTCICCEEKMCCAAGEDQFPIGMIKEDGFICKIGLPCCSFGLKVPDMKDLISTEGQCLCAKAVAQFPFGDKVKEPVCAICFVSLLPKFGVMEPPAGAPEIANMER